MSPQERERLGRVVREAWIAWAAARPNPKPSWLLPWEELSEPDREADRVIGEAVAAAVLAERPVIIWKGDWDE